VSVDHTYNPSYSEGRDQEDCSWLKVSPGQMKPYLKNTQHKKRAVGVAQTVDRLSSNTNSAKKKKKKPSGHFRN
jgi:hypothetical protein